MNSKDEKLKLTKKFDVPLIIIAFVAIVAIVYGSLKSPEGLTAVTNVLFGFTTGTLGAPILLFVFICLLLCLWIAFSKYGKIRLGNTKPEFSTFSYISMMVCSGFGSGTIYWAFLEFGYYITTPPFGIEAMSTQAFDIASAYNFHHWGPVAWCIYCIASIPIAYMYHVCKAKTLRVSEISADLVPQKASKLMSKFVDYVYILSTLAGIAFFVAISAPIISAAISAITGLPDGFGLAAGVVIAVSVIYTLSSYVGIEKGMKKISDYGIYLLLAFTAIIIVFGNTRFIMDQTLTGIGLSFQNIIKMCLYTDAIGKQGFPQNWTVWFWSYWLIYAPFMGVFVARVSKGRTLKEVVLCMVFGGGFGTGIFITALNAFSMDLQLSGKVAMSTMLNDGMGNQAIINAINTLPGSKLILILFAICLILLLATTLDGSSFSLSSNCQKIYTNGTEPSRLLRVFWCVTLTLLPFTLMYIKAPVSTLQTCSLVFSIPIMIIIFVTVKGFIKDMKNRFGNLTEDEIEKLNKITE